jgi:hypothetical protein
MVRGLPTTSHTRFACLRHTAVNHEGVANQAPRQSGVVSVAQYGAYLSAKESLSGMSLQETKKILGELGRNFRPLASNSCDYFLSVKQNADVHDIPNASRASNQFTSPADIYLLDV